MKPEIKEILTNKEVIAVDQDKAGKQGRKIIDTGDLEIWSKDLYDGSKAVVLFNRAKVPQKGSVTWNKIGINSYEKLKVRDLWQHKDLGKFKNSFSATVPPHDVIMIKVSK